MTIKTRFVVVALIVLFLILLATGFVYFRSENILTDFIDKAGLEYTVLSAQTVRDKLDTIAATTEAVGACYKFGIENSNLSEEELEKMAMGVLAECAKNGISDTFFGNAANGRLSTSSGWKEPDDYKVETRPWYIAATKAGRRTVAFSTPYVSAATGKAVLTASVPVYDANGKLMGVAASDMDLSYISKFILSCRIMGAGTGVLVQENGLILVHPNPGYQFKVNILSEPSFDESMKVFTRKMLGGEAGSAMYKFDPLQSGSFETRKVFFAPVGYGYYLYIYFPLSIIKKTARHLTNIFLLLAAVAFLSIIIIGILLLKRLDTIAADIESVSERLINGDTTARFDLEGRRELFHILKALNSAIETVAATQENKNAQIQLEASSAAFPQAGMPDVHNTSNLLSALQQHSTDSLKAAEEAEKLLADTVQMAIRVQIVQSNVLNSNVKLNNAIQNIAKTSTPVDKKDT